MSYEYRPMDGYRFLLRILSIICRNNQIKSVFDDTLKDAESGRNDNVVMDFLSPSWVKFSSGILNNKDNSRLRKEMLDYYGRVHVPEDDEAKIRNNLDGYKDTLRENIKAIVVTKRETRDPKVALGFATVLSLALMTKQADENFYVGTEEARKILYLCMTIFGYRNTEFIPDSCFEEIEDLGKLLFSAVYGVLMVLFPARKDVRDSNYNNQSKIIYGLIAGNVDSKLYTAFDRVTEAEAIASRLWELGLGEEPCLELKTEPSGALSIRDSYIIPKICSETPKTKVMSHERGMPIRSLVEGRSGVGKSTLGRLIAAISLSFSQKDDPLASEKSQKMCSLLDISGKMWAITVECKDLRPEEMNQGLLRCGLYQMLVRANSRGAGINIVHFQECMEYIMAFCNHKILQEQLVLIIDDYAKIPPNCVNTFNRLLKELCAEPRLHVVILTDKLKPSVKIRLPKGVNSFSISDIYPEEEYIKTAAKSSHREAGEVDDWKIYLPLYANTPRRLLRYIQAVNEGEGLSEVLSACVEEELDTRGHYFEYREEYPLFLRELTIWSLKRRGEVDRRSGRLTISEKQAVRFLSGHCENREEWDSIWRCICSESLVLEQCSNVNSMEFCTPMYLYSILADYYEELIRDASSDSTWGIIFEGFSYLAGSEFAYVILLIFHRLFQDGFRDIPESNIDLFAKAVISKLFELDTYENLEYGKWALGLVVSNPDYEKAFLCDGKASIRAKSWRMLRRACAAMDSSMNQYREMNLLMG